MTISNTLTNSRREAAFMKRIPLTNDERLTYIKQAIAGAHIDLLIPAIQFTHIEKDNRRFDYAIIINNTVVTSGTIHQSRNQANRWTDKNNSVRNHYIKSMIASIHKDLLHPHIIVYINTIESSYRTINYLISM